MKKLLVSGQKYGPFNVVEIFADKIVCDGFVFPRTVIGEDFSILDWNEESDAPVVAAPVPQSVTLRQAKDALLLAGYLEAVDTAISQINDPIKKRRAQNAWNHAQTVDRSYGLVVDLASVLGLTEEQVDDLFRLAATL